MDFGKYPQSRLLFSKRHKGFKQPWAYRRVFSAYAKRPTSENRSSKSARDSANYEYSSKSLAFPMNVESGRPALLNLSTSKVWNPYEKVSSKGFSNSDVGMNHLEDPVKMHIVIQ